MTGGSPTSYHWRPKHILAAGFTIVEVLIVLAVSMAMFASAMLLINGKQNTAAFNQSIHNIQTELQQTINEVGSGYYPNNGTLTCQNTGPGGSLSFTNTGSDSQGSNQKCIFLGRVLQFAVNTGSSDPETYNIYTLAGLTSGVTGSTVNMSAAKARIIARGSSDPADLPDAFEPKNLLYGLSLSRTYLTNHPATSAAAVGIISNITSLGSNDGSQQVTIVPINTVAPGTDKPTAVDLINANIAASYTGGSGGTVQLCFNSGGTDQSGLLTLGGSGRQGTIDLQIFSHGDCT